MGGINSFEISTLDDAGEFELFAEDLAHADRRWRFVADTGAGYPCAGYSQSCSPCGGSGGDSENTAMEWLLDADGE